MIVKSSVVAVVVVGSLAVPTAAWARVPEAHHHVRTVTAAANGTKIAVRDGKKVRVKLATSVDGGYSWYVKHRPAPDVVRIVRKTLKADPHSPHEAGYGYHTSYLLKADGKGTSTIVLVEKRAYGSHAIKRFRLTIRVVK